MLSVQDQNKVDSDVYKAEPNEEYMNDKQVAHFRKLLLQWKNTLLVGVTETVNQIKDESMGCADLNDRATQEEEFTLELRTRDRESRLIRKIDESLRMLEQGEYGFCESCGAEIGVRRLEARLTATLCIDCKTVAEKREKQHA